MTSTRIIKTIISNIGLVPEYGLQYGQLGNLIALFSVSQNGNFVPPGILRKHLIQIISKETSDGSYSIGILGIMIGVLFLKLNEFIEIDFDNIYYKHHQKLSKLYNNLELSSEAEKLHYINFLIYKFLLAKCKSKLPFETNGFEGRKISELYSLKSVDDVDRLFYYTQIIRRFILLHKLDAPFVTKEFVNKSLSFLFDSSKHNAILSYDGDFLVEVFKYSKENRQNEILKSITDCIRYYIENITFNIYNYKCAISSYNLMKFVNFEGEFEKLVCPRIMNDIKDRINNIDGPLCHRTNLDMLMGLKGGFSRHIIYENDMLSYKEAILL